MTHEDVEKVFQTADSYAVIERVQRDGGTSVEIAKRYQQLANDVYWKSRHAAAAAAVAVAVSRGGISYCLTKSLECAATDAAGSLTLRDIAKQMAYNLASFAWPGWDEPGITLTPAD